MTPTGIEWTEETWNPVTGCDQVSPGCANCYAMTFAERFRGVEGHTYEHGFDLQLRPDRLKTPLGWKKPRTIFVNSMSDLFHPEIPPEYTDRVFATMTEAAQHTFQILTKRPERAAELADRWAWPPNVWMGVSVENQHWTSRIEILRTIPAADRFLSCEPLLAPLDLGGLVDVGLGDCRRRERGRGPADGRRVGAQPPRPVSRGRRAVLFQAMGRIRRGRRPPRQEGRGPTARRQAMERDATAQPRPHADAAGVMGAVAALTRAQRASLGETPPGRGLRPVSALTEAGDDACPAR